ncbi:hypothetical protein MJH12_09435 [bacterium]|nr:hypothetical protein [bacterium]
MKKALLLLSLILPCLQAEDLSSIDQYDLLLNQTIQDDSTKTKLDLKTIRRTKFAAKVGLISLDLVYLFHPKMKNYNYVMNSFFREVPKNLSIPLTYYMKNKLKVYKVFKKTYLSKHRNFQREMKELKKDLGRLQESFMAMGDLSLSTYEFRKREKNYWKTRYQLEAEKKSLKESFDLWVFENDDDLLMSEKERDLQCAQIVKEVQNMIDVISKKEQINFVFNLDSNIAKGSHQIQLPKKTLFFQEYNDYSMLLQDELYFNYQKRGETYQYYQALKSHLSYYPQLKKSFSKNFKVTPFVGKRKNITLDVLNRLFIKYGYPQKMKQQILGLVSKIAK